MADEESGTFSAHQEERDGEKVVGEYSYIDPSGALVKVNYTADNDGYHVDRHVQDGFVDPSFVVPIQTVQAVTTNPNRYTTARPPTTPVVQEISTGILNNNESNSGNSDYDLVARIIAQLTPHIKQSVSTSLHSKSGINSLTSDRSTVSTFTPIPIEHKVQVPVQVPITIAPTTASNRHNTATKDEDLVAKIISQLTPHIRHSVSTNLGASNQRGRAIRPVQAKSYISTSSLPQKTTNGNEQDVTQRILTELTPLILQSVPKSLGHSDKRTLSLSQGELHHTKNSSPLNAESSDNELADAILAQLSPLVEEKLRKDLKTEYVSSNPNIRSKIGPSIEDSTGKNERSLINSIISELAPAIQTLVSSSLENETRNTGGLRSFGK